MAYGGSISGITRRVGAYVDRIFKGAKPVDLPVERATIFELAINLKTAKTLGLTIPPSLLLRADQVIVMNRRAFVGRLAAGLLGAPLVAEAQQVGKVYRIGFLSSSGCPILPEILGPFRQGLRELGYVEGQSILIVCRGAPGAADRLPGFAAELVRLNVDVLVAQGTASALAAKQATKTIPIVMVSVGDPVGSGLVTSRARLLRHSGIGHPAMLVPS